MPVMVVFRGIFRGQISGRGSAEGRGERTRSGGRKERLQLVGDGAVLSESRVCRVARQRDAER